MNLSLRVLLLTSEFPPHTLGGLGTHVHQLVTGLVRSHCQVFVFVLVDGQHEHRQTITVTENGNLTVCLCREPMPGNLVMPLILRGTRTVIDAAVSFFSGPFPKPHVIHFHDWIGFCAAERLGRILGIPIVGTAHLLHKPLSKVLGLLRDDDIAAIEARMCSRSDALIAVSRSVRRDLEVEYGVRRKVAVVYNGLDLPAFDTLLRGCAQGADPESHSSRQGGRNIIYAGRLVPQKGLSALIRSASRVLHRFNDVTYLIAGEPADAGYLRLLRSMVETNPKVRPHIRFLGWQSREELARLYRTAYMAIAPSYYEPFGYAATEAMAAGVPVVASEAGGLAEIIVNRQCGLLVPFTIDSDGITDLDVDKLSEAQIELLSDSALAKRLGDAGRKRMEKEFSLPQMIHHTLNVYRSVVQRDTADRQGS